jgi:WD40 repeat protein
VSYSPDGKLLAAAMESSLHAFNLGGGESQSFPWKMPSDPVPRENADVVRQTGSVVEECSQHQTDQLSPVTFSPDGSHIICGCPDKKFRIYSTRDWSEREVQTDHLCEISCLEYSPAGDLLVSGSLDRQIKIWDAKTYELNDIQFSPDGRALVIAGPRGFLDCWFR